MAWYRKTAAMLEAEAGNDGAALFRLAHLIEHGLRGAAPDPERAREILQRAASAGSPAAALSVGNRLYRGEGVPQNLDDGMNWYRYAAQLGSRDGQCNIGSYLLENGNRADGIAWMRLAAAQGQPYAASTLPELEDGGPSPDSDARMAKFASMSLEEMAARGADAIDFDVTLTLGGNEQQLNDGFGNWIEALLGPWRDLAVDAKVGDVTIDFPGLARLPRNVREDHEQIELTIGLGQQPLTCAISFDGDDTWSANLHTGGSPSPAQITTYALRALEGAVIQAGMAVERSDS